MIHMRDGCVRTLVLLGALSLLVPGVGARSLKREIKVTLREKRVQDMSPEGLTIGFILEVANASSEPCLLAGYDYRVMVEKSEYFRLEKTLDSPLDIAPSGRTLIALPVKFTYDFVRPLVPGLSDLEKFDCTLVGGLVFSAERGRRGERLNLALTADVPVYKGFRATAAPLEIRALSVGGADLCFRAEFLNQSSFPLDVESIRYRLDLGGVKVAEGTAAGARLGPAASASLVLPLLMEFFEMGADLYPLLRRQEVEFKLTGELRLVTGWGSQLIPFLEAGRISVRRSE